MKKTLFISAVILLSSVFTAVNAQEKASFGVKLNTNLTSVKLSKLQGTKEKFNPGASLGVFTKINLGENLAIQPELMFNYTEAKIRCYGEKTKYKYAGVELPIYMLGQINAGNGKVFLGIGPHIGYGFSIDSKIENLPSDCSLKNKIELEHWYAGGGITAGYEFRNRISLHTGYQLSFDFSSNSYESKVKTQTINLGIGYRF